MRPPRAQLLYDVGMPLELLAPLAEIPSTPPIAPFPVVCTKPLTKPPSTARQALLLPSEFVPVRRSAAAAKINFVWDQSDVDVVSLTPNRWDYAYDVTAPLDPHPHAGLHLVDVADKKRVQIISCVRSMAAVKMPWWRSLLRHKYVDHINDKRVHTCMDVFAAIARFRRDDASIFTLTLATDASDLPPILQQGFRRSILTS